MIPRPSPLSQRAMLLYDAGEQAPGRPEALGAAASEAAPPNRILMGGQPSKARNSLVPLPCLQISRLRPERGNVGSHS